MIEIATRVLLVCLALVGLLLALFFATWVMGVLGGRRARPGRAPGAPMSRREPPDPVGLIVVEPDAKGLAALVERLTGHRPDVAKIQARLGAPAPPRPH
jgi:hypothetical protein